MDVGNECNPVGNGWNQISCRLQYCFYLAGKRLGDGPFPEPFLAPAGHCAKFTKNCLGGDWPFHVTMARMGGAGSAGSVIDFSRPPNKPAVIVAKQSLLTDTCRKFGEGIMNIIAGLLKALSGLIGLVAGLFGIVALVFEVMVWIPDSARASISLGQVWFQNDPFANLVSTPSLPLFGAIVERRISPALWDPFIVTILAWPSWLALLFVAVLFLSISSLFMRFARSGKATAQS